MHLTVSVVVPTRDRPAALRRCLRSLETAGGARREVVVVVDGGCEPDLLGPSGLNLQIVRHSRSLGPAAARNAGAVEARSPLLAFLDDDCEAEPGWLDRLVEPLESEPSALVGVRTVNALTDDPYARASQLLLDYLEREGSRGAASAPPFFPSNNLACRRDELLSIGGFDESFSLPAAEDRDLCERWRRRGPLVRAPEAVVRHAHHLDLAGFWRQHWRYGRGAATLLRRRRQRGDATPWPRIGFYLRLLGAATSRGRSAAIARSAALLSLSQIAHACGLLAQVLIDLGTGRRESTTDTRYVL